jgi:hypothetical protein
MFHTQYNFPIYKLIHLFTSTNCFKFLLSVCLLWSSLFYVITYRRKLGHVTIRSMEHTTRWYIITHEKVTNPWWNCSKFFIRKLALWLCKCLDKAKQKNTKWLMQKLNPWTHNWSLIYLHQHHIQRFALCISQQNCIACTSNNNSHSEWYLTPAFYTIIEKITILVYIPTHIYGLYQKSTVNLHCIFIFWIVGPTSGHAKSIPTVTKKDH